MSATDIPNLKTTFYRALLRTLSTKKGLFLGVFSILLFALARQFPQTTHAVYREGVFRIIRIIWDYSVGWFQIPMIYLVVFIWVVWLVSFYRSSKNRQWLTLLNGVGWIIGGFLWLWGFNYAATTLKTQEQRIQLDAWQLFEFGCVVAKHLNGFAEHTERYDDLPTDAASSSVKNYLQACGWKIQGKAHCQEIPGAMLRRAGVAGVYLPFAMEGQCDGSFPSYIKNMIKAHELAHAYGVTDEGEADFTAFAALLRASADTSNPAAATMRYAALFDLTRSIRSELRVLSDSLRKELDKQLSNHVMMDLIYTRVNNALYPPYFPEAQSKINHAYLKTMGVQEGIKSYDAFCGLAYQSWVSGEIDLIAE